MSNFLPQHRTEAPGDKSKIKHNQLKNSTPYLISFFEVVTFSTSDKNLLVHVSSSETAPCPGKKSLCIEGSHIKGHLHRSYHGGFDVVFPMIIDCFTNNGLKNYIIIIAKELIMIMTVAMITMMNSNDLTNIFTWEGFLLLSIHLLMVGKSLCWITRRSGQSPCSSLQQQARPV